LLGFHAATGYAAYAFEEFGYLGVLAEEVVGLLHVVPEQLVAAKPLNPHAR
jgi:hypothetical protein